MYRVRTRNSQQYHPLLNGLISCVACTEWIHNVWHLRWYSLGLGSVVVCSCCAECDVWCAFGFVYDLYFVYKKLNNSLSVYENIVCSVIKCFAMEIRTRFELSRKKPYLSEYTARKSLSFRLAVRVNKNSTLFLLVFVFDIYEMENVKFVLSMFNGCSDDYGYGCAYNIHLVFTNFSQSVNRVLYFFL